MVRYSSYDKTIPKVKFETKELELFINDLMIENHCNDKSVNEYIGLVMLRLGFTPEDNIYLCKFDKDNKEGYFKCVVNYEYSYNIKFKNIGNLLTNTLISLNRFNETITYECIPLDVSEIGLKIIPVIKEIVYPDGFTYRRYLSDQKARFVVLFDDYKLELNLTKPDNLKLPMFDSEGKYSNYRVNNEEELVSCLESSFPICLAGSIIDVYKKICDISLGSDVSIYPEISLSFSMLDGDSWKVTNLIHLKSGELERFGITLPKYGRTLFLNKDGSCIYELNDIDGLFNVSMELKEDKTNYNISIENGSDIGMVSKMIQSDIEGVKESLDSVKKLVREKFGNTKKGSN